MSRALVLAVVLTLVLAVPVLAQDEGPAATVTAAPSLIGPTGAIVTPTTELPPLKGFNVGYHWLNNTLDTSAKLNATPIDKLELGVTWYDPADPTLDQETLFSAKYLLVKEEGNNPAVAVGVWDIADDVDQTFYGVISKGFNLKGEVPITVNLGGGSGDMLDGFFGSVKLALHEDVDVIGEYDSSELNFGLRLRPYQNLTVDLITVDNRVDREFGAGLAYTATW